jgi:hypothetical protein
MFRWLATVRPPTVACQMQPACRRVSILAMSETIHELVLDRSRWGSGPWDTEPNRWEDRHAGFPVLAVRNDTGAWCGYVGVPPGHPWRGQGYDDVDVQVHGGLTYAGLCNGLICHVPREGEPAEVMWFGFDCAHAGDLVPGFTHFHALEGGDVYRTLEYVQAQARALAEQAAAAR